MLWRAISAAVDARCEDWRTPLLLPHAAINGSTRERIQLPAQATPHFLY